MQTSNTTIPTDKLVNKKTLRLNVKKTKTLLCINDIATEGKDMNASEIMDCAVTAIKNGEIEWAKRLLREAMAQDMENPEAYNLLGIAYEKQGNKIKASKYYRVAYYMDQTFNAASENLNRTSQFLYKGCGNDEIKWGLKK